MKKSNKYTLLIDGNYFLFRTLFVLPRSKKTNEILGTAEDIGVFVRKLATDLSYQIRLFDGLIEKIVWVNDSKSWRKDFYPDANYKGTRKQNDSLNWENYSKAADDFISTLSKRGIIISKVNGAEGDDLLYAWSTYLNNQNKSCIIFSGDKDMIQLVNQTENCHTLVFAPVTNKLFTYPGFNQWLTSSEESDSSNDIFDIIKETTSSVSNIKKSLQLTISSKKINIVETDVNDFRILKVLTGDSGDNVPSAYWYVLGNRTYGISDKKANEILTEFKNKYNISYEQLCTNSEILTEFANTLIKVANAKHMSREQIISNIKMNIILLILSDYTIPEKIINDMSMSIENKMDFNSLDLKGVSSMKSLLEGTSYFKESESITVSSNIFGNEDDNDDFSFIKDRKSQKTVF